MDPSHSIEVAHGAHVFGQVFGLRPLEIVDDGDDLAVGLEGGANLAVNPILALVVAHAPIQRVGCQHQQEVFCQTDALQQVVVEFTRLQTLHVDEHRVIAQLQVNCRVIR